MFNYVKNGWVTTKFVWMQNVGWSDWEKNAYGRRQFWLRQN